MPRLNLQITDQQQEWIKAQTGQFRSQADVVRDLIDAQIRTLQPWEPLSKDWRVTVTHNERQP